MKRVKLVLVPVMVLLTFGSAEAQNMLGRLADRAKNAAENAVGKKLENAVYNAVDKAFTNDNAAKRDARPSNAEPAARKAPSQSPATVSDTPKAPVQDDAPVSAAPKTPSQIPAAPKAPVAVTAPVQGAVSFKYNSGEGSEGRYYVYTRTDDQARLDSFDEGMMLDENDVEVAYSYHDVMLSPKRGETPVKYEDGSWTESYSAAQEVAIIWSALIRDRSDFYVQKDGFSEAGTAIVCGRTCRKYVGTIRTMGGYDHFIMNGSSAEIYIWNGYTMKLVMGGKVVHEVVGYTDRVPESAFTQTLDVNWL